MHQWLNRARSLATIRHSQWTFALALAAVTFVAWGQSHAEEPARVQVEKGIVYGKGGETDLELDLYRPAKPGSSAVPGIIVIHGGAWRAGNRADMAPIAQQLAEAGYVAATISYRFCPKDRFPAQIEDAKCAVRWMRANAADLGVDAERIGATGASAGGHLSLLLGLMDEKDGFEGNGGHTGHSSKVQCVVNYFGPTDMTLRDWHPKDERLLVDFFGGKLSEIPRTFEQGSPVTYIDAKDPPVLTFHGTHDPLVPYGQAILLDHELRKAGVASKLVPMIGASHGWIGPDLAHTQALAIEFFHEHLGKPR